MKGERELTWRVFHEGREDPIVVLREVGWWARRRKDRWGRFGVAGSLESGGESC